MLDNLDPKTFAKWDREEGEKEREKVILQLRQRISSRHPATLFSTRDGKQSTPEFGIDDYLTDQKQQEQENEMDEALANTIELIKEFADCFARSPKNPGTTSKIEHKIETEGSLPSSPPMYRRSQPDRQLIKEWIEWMLKNGLIEKSDAAYAQNILIVRKPGKEPRVCLDPRPINKITKNDPFPTPRMDELFSSLKGSKIFSSFDAAAGFWQVPIAKKDRHKTAFRTMQGVFQFTVMPFGLRNSPATFTRWMDATFRGLEHYLKIYIDDLLVHSKSISEHPSHLRQLLMKCRDNGVKLRLTKCKFLQEEVEMLGYIVTPNGVKKDMKKVEAIVSWGEGRKNPTESPFKGVTSLQSFLGMVNFYRHFHKFFANELLILSAMTKKGRNVKKEWNVAHELAFQKIKATIAEQTLLSYPDEDEAYFIHTDASNYAIGGTLLQIELTKEKTADGKPIYKVIEHYSRGLIPAERNYSVTEREFLAIITCIEKWRHYLYKPFTVVTDHKPLLGIQHTEKPRMKRWALRITPYHFEIQHAPGVEMTDVDPLSRDPKYFRMTFESDSSEPAKGNMFDQEKLFRVYVSENVEIHAEERVAKLFQSIELPIHRPEKEKGNSWKREIQPHPQRSFVERNQEDEDITVLRTKIQEAEEEEKEEMELIQPLRATCLQISEPKMTLQVGNANFDHDAHRGDAIIDLRCYPLNVEIKGQEECLDEKEIDEQTTPTSPAIDEEQPESTKKGKSSQKSVELKEQKALEELFESLGLSQEGVRPVVLYPGSQTFAHEQDADPLLKKMKIALRRDGNTESYFLEKESNLLMRRSKKGCPRVVVPEQSVDTLLYLYHDHPLAGHAKSEKMLKALSTSFYFQNMQKRVKQWVKQCKCMRAIAKLHHRAGMSLSRPISRIFHTLYMDIVGPFPPSRRQNRYWLTLMDAYNKDLELVPIRSGDAVQVAKAIMIHWVCRRGCPRLLVSDNAKAFIGRVLQHLCQILNVRQDLITPYHHKGTGLIERVHSYAESIMRTATEQKYSLWDEKLPFIQFAIMTHTIDNSEVTPFQLKYGVPPTLPGDLLVDSFDLPKNLKQYYENAQKAINATRKYFSIQRKKRRIQTRLARDRLERRYRVLYSPGDWVFVSKPSFLRVEGVKGVKKVEGQHRGPYEVTRIDNHNNVFVRIDGREDRFSVEFCEPAHTKEPKSRLPPQYLDGLRYDPKDPEQDPVTIPEEKTYNLRQKREKIVSQETKPDKRKKKLPQSSVTRGRKERLFAIIQDKVLGQHYATELTEEDGIQKAHLYKKAKKGQYHPVWFDPQDLSDPPKSKSQPSRPKGWEPWTVIPEQDESWEIIKPIAKNLKLLDHSLIK